MSKLDAPCYKCEERHLGCHSSCERYGEYAKAMEEVRKARFETSERIIHTETKKTLSQLKQMRKGKK